MPKALIRTDVVEKAKQKVLGWIETLAAFETIGPVERAQFHQFLYPEVDVLPRSEERPTSLTRNKDQIFRSVKNFYPETIAYVGGHAGAFVDADLPKVLKQSDVVGQWADNSLVELAPRLGLGDARVSVGKDPKKGYYLSVYDSWDFRSGPGHSGSGLALDRAIAERLGKGFNVYDRFYFEPEKRADGTLSIPSTFAVKK
jgi:hypothetical protein